MSDGTGGTAASEITAQASGPATEEALRLSRAFEQVARIQLAAMTVSARAIVRAWAEAEMAIGVARASGEPNSADLPSAEAFRAAPYLAREEVSRESITCWVGSGRQPLSNGDGERVLYRDGRWFLPVRGTDRPQCFLTERAEFERVTYDEPMALVEAPLLIAALSVPGLLADDAPGWQSDHVSDVASAACILSRLDAMVQSPDSNRAERVRTVEYTYVRGVSRPKAPDVGGD